MLEHVLPDKSEDGGKPLINFAHLTVIRAKYPTKIPALYRTVLDKRLDVEDRGFLALAILKCNLADKEKWDLLLKGAKHNDSDRRLSAYYAMRSLDKKRFTPLLLATSESFPEDVPGPYWNCHEAAVANMAISCEDPRIWKTLAKVAKRSAVGLRMQLLNHFDDPKDARQRPERLRLLASFLDDASLRDEKSSRKFEGPGAGFPYPKIEVRDFVALKIARMLEIEIETDFKRSPEEWAKIRSQVREAVKRELDKSK